MPRTEAGAVVTLADTEEAYYPYYTHQEIVEVVVVVVGVVVVVVVVVASRGLTGLGGSCFQGGVHIQEDHADPVQGAMLDCSQGEEPIHSRGGPGAPYEHPTAAPVAVVVHLN